MLSIPRVSWWVCSALPPEGVSQQRGAGVGEGSRVSLPCHQSFKNVGTKGKLHRITRSRKPLYVIFVFGLTHTIKASKRKRPKKRKRRRIIRSGKPLNVMFVNV